jgi:RHS repeat-associated protein
VSRANFLAWVLVTAAVETVATAISFQPHSDLLKSATHGNGLQTNASYDLDHRLTQLQVLNGAALVQGSSYAYADTLNLTGITDQVTAANSNTLSYSPTNRLASASGAWGTNSFTYDAVGNRLTDVTTAKNRVATYGTTTNRLSTLTENSAAFRSYTYDNGGNTLTETRPGESLVYAYNKRNRLTGVTRNGVSYAAYGYNALEQMTSRVTSAAGAPAGTVHYLYDQDGHLIAEADAATGATLRDYVWLPDNDNGNDTLADDFLPQAQLGGVPRSGEGVSPPDLPLAVIDAVNTATPITSFIHTDHLGRPTRMTDAAKATVWSATWKPWGEVQALSGTSTNNLRFPGQYFQIETGLHYNWHRHYDPVTGRYTQPDPLRFVDGPSVYAYARSSPFMRVDRDGQIAPIVAAVVGGAIGGAVGAIINNGGWECTSWEDLAEGAFEGATVGFSYFKALKAYRFFSGVRSARIQYPGKAFKRDNHHINPRYMGGPANGPTANVDRAYYQAITNAFRRGGAPFRRDRVYKRRVTPGEAREIARRVYDKHPLSWW